MNAHGTVKNLLHTVVPDAIRESCEKTYGINLTSGCTYHRVLYERLKQLAQSDPKAAEMLRQWENTFGSDAK